MTNDVYTEAAGLVRAAQLPVASQGLCVIILTLQRAVADLEQRIAALEAKNSSALE